VRRCLLIVILLVAGAVGSLAAHDLFLTLDTHFVPPDTPVRLRLLNGTFTKSENSVTKNRVEDISVVGPQGKTHPDTAVWRDSGDTTIITLRTAEAGTYVIGASIRPTELTLAAKDFNEYLASDGVPDVLEARRRSGGLGKPARERYSKHVKALLQVGDARSESFGAVLGYPAEIVPLVNPYTLRMRSSLAVRALVDGKAVANQLVIAGGRTRSGARIGPHSLRTDSSGITRIRLTSRGRWYVKFIHMVPAVGDSTIDYRSKWATLTFEVR
jgi:uncharacterized GH25 family protein